MRIILQYYYGFLQKKTEKLNIDDEETTTKLLELIQGKVGRQVKDLIIKFKRDGFTLKVLPGWPLSHYDIQNGQHVQVEIKESEVEQKINESKRVNQRYLNKLGFEMHQKLENVEEDSEGEVEDIKNKSKNSTKLSDSSLHPQERSKSGSSNEGETIKPGIYFDQKPYLERFQKNMFEVTKTGVLENLQKLFESTVDVPDELFEQVMLQKQLILKTATYGGWNALHFAIYQNSGNIVTYLIQQGMDLNKATDDGWSPFQISVHKNNMAIFKLLLKEQELKINQVTDKGLALNIACKSGRINMIQQLLQAGADPSIQDKDGYNAFDLSSSQEVLNILNKTSVEERKEEEQLRPQSFSFHPPKPPIVKGFVEKTGGLLFNTSKRYFVLNPEEGSLIRYKRFDDCPLNPLEIIPLKNIKHVQMCERQWYMKTNLFYFEVFYNSRIILACLHENAAKAWVFFIYQAAVYSIFTEERQLGDIELATELTEVIIQDQDNKIPSQMITLLNSSIQPKSTEKVETQDRDKIQVPQTQSRSQTEITNSQEDNQGAKRFTLSDPPVPQQQQSQQLKQSQTQEKKQQQNIVHQRSPSPPSQLSDSSLEVSELVKDSKVNFESFEIIKLLGSGAFGKVFLVRKKDDDRIFAMKALKKRNLIIKKQLKYAVTEANVLKTCRHPFILGLHYAFQTPNFLYLVLDYCPGGDLSYHLTQRNKFSEIETRFYIAELILAIEYLHQTNVVYRDLKPENILLDKDGHIKLADFGLSKEGVGDSDKTRSFCGSPAYLSPEMLSQKGAGKSSDVYGIGAVMYEMISGEPPYYSDDIPTMYKNIKEGILKFPKGMTEEAKNCIKRLLERDPNKRLGAKNKQEIKDDPFFQGLDWERVYRREFRPPITDFSDQQDDDHDEYDELGYHGKPIFNDIDYAEDNVKVNRVIKFSFTSDGTKSQ